MSIRQISVFLEDSTNRLSGLVKTLGREGIDIQAISFTETADIGIFRLVTNKCDEAIKALNDANFTTRISDVSAVEIGDAPGSLARAVELFEKTGVVVEHLYTARTSKEGKAVIIFKLRNHKEGLKILRENGLSLVQHL